jgi:flagellar biosynthesis protein FlhA
MATDLPAPASSPSPLLNLWMRRMSDYGDIGFALAIISLLIILLFPVPTFLLDVLLALSIGTAVLILMTTLFIDKPLEFSVFPTVLLVSAVMRLSLNIASTRLILADGHLGPSAAGHVIEAFGGFVMQGNIVIGAIVFAILTIINFVVITKGSGRIAEVAARFSLDAMPGKQMAIDADLAAGLIDQAAAKARRKALEDESTFFGAMDGANKFVRGDAIAGLLITFINLIAGIIIGILQRNLTFEQALTTYTMLTVGDGLVSQIPALSISLASGLLVSKSGMVGSAEKAIFEQLGRYPQAMGVSAALLATMAVMPGLPAVPFLLLASMTGVLSYYIYHRGNVTDAETLPPPVDATEEPISESLRIETIRIELGLGLIGLINYQQGHRLTEQIKILRKQMARDLGFVIPAVRLQDNMQLPTNDYAIYIKDIECARGEIFSDKLMVINPSGKDPEMPGYKTRDPAFGLPALWIEESRREEALFRHYTVVDPPTVITTHLTSVVKDNIIELLSYSETQKLVQEMTEEHPKLLADLIPSPVSLSLLHRVLQQLLVEMISIRDLPTIIEAIAEIAKHTQHVDGMVEHVRQRLARQISYAYLDKDGGLPIVTLSGHWEQTFAESVIGSGEEKQLALSPSDLQHFSSDMRHLLDQLAAKNQLPVLVVSAALRAMVYRLLERLRPGLAVLSQHEIYPRVRVKVLGQIGGNG